MPKRIEQWEAKDHARFDTEDEAVAHDAALLFCETCGAVGWDYVPSNGMDEDKWRRVAHWLIEAKPIVLSFYKDLPEIE